MLNKVSDERLQELLEIEKAKVAPDINILYSLASESRYRNRDAIAVEIQERKNQVLTDLGQTMKSNRDKAAAAKALLVPVKEK